MAASSVSLKKGLPASIWPGKGTALYIRGNAWSSSGLRDVGIETGLQGMGLQSRLRPDYHVLNECCRARNKKACLMSGFTGLVKIPSATGHGDADWKLSARFRNDPSAEVAGGRIEIRQGPPVQPSSIDFPDDTEARVVICMATYEPDVQAFRRQIDSIRTQTHGNWHCIINDDNSSDEAFARYNEVLGDDHRFSVYRNETNLGFYHNFEVALSRVPANVDYVALADQDDAWYPEKIASCLAAFKPDTTLVYSDMRIVDENGAVLSDTYWSQRRNNYVDAHVLLLANTVTGAASILRRELLDDILPFPEPVGQVFHDHWIACVARCRGPLSYVDEPLYDYYQYGSSVIGHCDFEHRGVLQRLVDAAGNLKKLAGIGRFKAWLLHGRNAALNVYRFEYLRLSLFREILLLRFPDLPSGLRRDLDMFADGWMAVRRLFAAHWRILLSGDTTDDAETRLAYAVIVNRLDSIYARLFAGRIVARHCRENTDQNLDTAEQE
jgi:glycosyltransferase involved in cell wall biosynthesis